MMFKLSLAALVGLASASELTWYGAGPQADHAIREQRRHWDVQGESATDAKLNFIFAVKQQNLDKLTSILNEVSDPTNEKYGDYLSFDELGNLIANEEGAKKIALFLSGDDAITYKTTDNADFITASMPVASAERLFKAKFNDYKRKDIDFTVSRSDEYTLPEELAEHVDFVEGLINFPSKTEGQSMMKTVLKAKTAGDAYPSVVNGHYNTEQVSAPFKGSVAVFETGQYTEATDLTDFETTYGLPAQGIAATVGSNEGFLCGISPNSCAEASLDVQYLIAVANGVPLTFWEVANSNDPFVSWAAAVAAESSPPLVHSISLAPLRLRSRPPLLSVSTLRFRSLVCVV